MTLTQTPSEAGIYQVKLPQIRLAGGATGVITYVDTLPNAKDAFAQIKGVACMLPSNCQNMTYMRRLDMTVQHDNTGFHGLNGICYQKPLPVRVRVERMAGRIEDWPLLEEFTNKLATALAQTNSGFAIWAPAGREIYRSGSVKLKF